MVQEKHLKFKFYCL